MYRIDCQWWFGKVSAVIKPDGTRMEYEYNPLGQLARKMAKQESRIQNSESRMNGGTSSRSSEDSKNNLRESASSAGSSASTAHSVTTSVVVSDFLGTTLGTVSGEHFAPVYLTAFGEQIASPTPSKGEASEINSGFGIQDSEFSASVFYTGKPYDEDLQAYHFLYRNYSPTQARWTAADPSGFPDGPNQLLYVNNGVMNQVDALGLAVVTKTTTVTLTRTGTVTRSRPTAYGAVTWQEQYSILNDVLITYQMDGQSFIGSPSVEWVDSITLPLHIGITVGFGFDLSYNLGYKPLITNPGAMKIKVSFDQVTEILFGFSLGRVGAAKSLETINTSISSTDVWLE